MADKLLAVFLKIRNGLLRNDLYNCLLNIQEYADEVFVCDDASFDGTTEILENIIPEENLLKIPLKDHSFAMELFHKEELLKKLHKKGPFSFVLWMDSDEILDAKGTEGIRDFCKQNLTTQTQGWAFHYTQIWRNTNYARTDDGFDDGLFIKLWRYRPDLTFNVEEGMHKIQFPKQILDAYNNKTILPAPFEIIHYGNVGENLKFKVIQYRNGLGGVDRHLRFNDKSTYRQVPQELFPYNALKVPGEKPVPFTSEQIKLLDMLDNLKKLPNHFCVIVPTYNRHDTLPRAFDSLIAQTYEKWHCVVLDDGSTDEKTEQVVMSYCQKDPRFFYVKYLEHRGGVAVNENGMNIALETADWWVRLGSDDWFFPHKLELDAKAFKEGHLAVYSPFIVHRDSVFGESANLPTPSEKIKESFPKGGFFASWASVAVSTQILKQIKEKYGNYVDPRIVNMEDRLFNYRVSTLCPWIFASRTSEGDIINPSEEVMKKIINKEMKIEHSGVWNVNMIGASANIEVYNKDSNLTTEIIANEEFKYEKK